MDYDEFALSLLIKQRHAEMIADARRRSLLRHRRRPPRLRLALGAALIRVGARLIREPQAMTGDTLQG